MASSSILNRLTLWFCVLACRFSQSWCVRAMSVHVFRMKWGIFCSGTGVMLFISTYHRWSFILICIYGAAMNQKALSQAPTAIQQFQAQSHSIRCKQIGHKRPSFSIRRFQFFTAHNTIRAHFSIFIVSGLGVHSGLCRFTHSMGILFCHLRTFYILLRPWQCGII